jgi:hypothetical protein
MSDQSAAAPVSPWRTRTPLLIGGAVVVLMNLTTALKQRAVAPDGTAESLGYFYGQVVGMLIGAALFLPTIVWLIVYFFFIRPSGRKVGLKYFGLLALAGALAAAPGAIAMLTAS